MSTKKRNNTNDSSLLSILDDKSIITTNTFLIEKLKALYPKEYLHSFIKNISRLSIQYQLHSDRCEQKKNEADKENNTINKILLKEIEICIDEIQRLNEKLIEKDNIIKQLKQNEAELESKRNKIKSLEKEINDRINNEKTIKEGVNSYIRQIAFYKDKLRFELRNGKSSKEKQLVKEEPVVLKVNRLSKKKPNVNNIAKITNTKGNGNMTYSIEKTGREKTSCQTDRQRIPIKDMIMQKYNQMKIGKKRNASELTKANSITSNTDRVSSLTNYSRNVKKNNSIKIVKSSLYNNLKNTIDPLYTDLNEHYNKEMVLLNYEESLLQKILSDLNTNEE